MFRRLFKSDPHEKPAQALYHRIVAQARRPEFYSHCAVPDTLDGRFELIVLHSFLVLHRLKQDRSETEALAQSLFDTLFRDMDRSLREIGVGDLSVGKKVKQMAEAFYGRVSAYDAGLDQEGPDLAEALGRNLYGTCQPSDEHLSAMAAYLEREMAGLRGQDSAAVMAGRLEFGDPPLGQGPEPAGPPERGRSRGDSD